MLQLHHRLLHDNGEQCVGRKYFCTKFVWSWIPPVWASHVSSFRSGVGDKCFGFHQYRDDSDSSALLEVWSPDQGMVEEVTSVRRYGQILIVIVDNLHRHRINASFKCSCRRCEDLSEYNMPPN